MKNLTFLLFVTLACMGVSIQIASAQESFSVGTRYYKFTDAARVDELFGEGNHRSVHLQVWFPIGKQQLALKRASYFPEIEKARPFLTNWSEEDFQFVKNVRTNSFEGAMPPEGTSKFPVLVFSPSLGGHTSLYSCYAERMADAGYVVVGVNHKYESNYVIEQSGNVIFQDLKFHDDLKKLRIPEDISGDAYRARKGERHRVLAEDLIFVLNQLDLMNKSDFDSRLDLTGVGVWGHSIGGAASIDAAIMDERFKAVLNIDGTPSGRALTEGIDRPYMYIEDLTDLTQNGYKIQFDRRETFCKKNSFEWYRVLIGNCNHNSFVDINYRQAKEPERKQLALNVLETSLYYMKEFFDLHVKNRKLAIMPVQSDNLKVIRSANGRVGNATRDR